MRINAQMDSDLEVSAISLVDVPATEKMWQAFKSTPQLMQFAQINEEEKIIVGAAMIPDLFIYRNDPERGEYNVVFSKETVRSIAEKFYAKGFDTICKTALKMRKREAIGAYSGLPVTYHE